MATATMGDETTTPPPATQPPPGRDHEPQAPVEPTPTAATGTQPGGAEAGGGEGDAEHAAATTTTHRGGGDAEAGAEAEAEAKQQPQQPTKRKTRAAASRSTTTYRGGLAITCRKLRLGDHEQQQQQPQAEAATVAGTCLREAGFAHGGGGGGRGGGEGEGADGEEGEGGEEEDYMETYLVNGSSGEGRKKGGRPAFAWLVRNDPARSKIMYVSEVDVCVAGKTAPTSVLCASILDDRAEDSPQNSKLVLFDAASCRLRTTVTVPFVVTAFTSVTIGAHHQDKNFFPCKHCIALGGKKGEVSLLGLTLPDVPPTITDGCYEYFWGCSITVPEGRHWHPLLSLNKNSVDVAGKFSYDLDDIENEASISTKHAMVTCMKDLPGCQCFGAGFQFGGVILWDADSLERSYVHKCVYMKSGVIQGFDYDGSGLWVCSYVPRDQILKVEKVDLEKKQTIYNTSFTNCSKLLSFSSCSSVSRTNRFSFGLLAPQKNIQSSSAICLDSQHRVQHTLKLDEQILDMHVYSGSLSCVSEEAPSFSFIGISTNAQIETSVSGVKSHVLQRASEQGPLALTHPKSVFSKLQEGQSMPQDDTGKSDCAEDYFTLLYSHNMAHLIAQYITLPKDLVPKSTTDLLDGESVGGDQWGIRDPRPVCNWAYACFEKLKKYMSAAGFLRQLNDSTDMRHPHCDQSSLDSISNELQSLELIFEALFRRFQNTESMESVDNIFQEITLLLQGMEKAAWCLRSGLSPAFEQAIPTPIAQRPLFSRMLESLKFPKRWNILQVPPPLEVLLPLCNTEETSTGQAILLYCLDEVQHSTVPALSFAFCQRFHIPLEEVGRELHSCSSIKSFFPLKLFDLMALLVRFKRYQDAANVSRCCNFASTIHSTEEASLYVEILVHSGFVQDALSFLRVHFPQGAEEIKTVTYHLTHFFSTVLNAGEVDSLFSLLLSPLEHNVFETFLSITQT
ncbi:hypothetical protein Pelo_17486 [Pelomyxa schiedti]|nr:hypothetical protein Pelo_17486 [Pelomyxa schiedti]